MAELTHYRCPNCGASITNTENCEYCGSLLVRFVKRGIDLSKTSYMSNDQVFPGLVQNLKTHLHMQRAYPNEVVKTHIFREKGKQVNTGSFALCVIKLNGTWHNKQPIFPGRQSEIGLCIVPDTSTYVDDLNNREYNNQMDMRLERFQQLDCFSLFTPHQCYMTDGYGNKRKERMFAINFGQDAEGAARLISEILVKVYQVPLNERIEIFTNHGRAIEDAYIRAKEERGEDMSNYRRSDGCYVATAVYGSYDCPEVWTLRRFRDYTLDETFAGRAFIKTYYAISPTLVRWFGKTKWFKAIWKPVLDKMVSRLQQKGVQSTPYKDKY